MGFVLNKKDLLNTDNTLIEFPINVGDSNEYFVLPSDKPSDDFTEIAEKIEVLKNSKIDNEIKSNILNEYSRLKSAKSLKEQTKIKNKLNDLFKENGLS